MTSTQQTTDYVLAQYRARPEAEQPCLVFRYISRQDRLRIEALFRQADTEKGEAYFDRVREGIRIALAGWRGYSIDYNPERLDEVLSDLDYGELRQCLIGHIRGSEFFCKACVRTRQSTQASDASEATTAATA